MHRLMWVVPLVLALGMRGAYADPVPIRITGGSMVLESSDPVARMSVSGTQDFALTGVGGGSFFDLCNPGCSPGEVLSLGGGTLDEFQSTVRVDVDGSPLTFSADDNSSNFRFETGLVRLPPLSSSGLFTIPFELHGALFLYDLPEFGEVRQFSVFGTGTARVELSPYFGAWTWAGNVREPGVCATYEFEPVPEPASLSLISLGILGCGVRWRRSVPAGGRQRRSWFAGGHSSGHTHAVSNGSNMEASWATATRITR